MTLNSINTNIAALRAQENIGAANRASSSSIARLSSGERIVRAADDVASVSAGTSLRTNVTTLRTALINTAQGSSLLQVADGALSEITDILLRQKAISVQAGSGSLTASERSFLNQEFQNLTQEIDRLADQTNFNGVTLLNGDLFDRTDLEQNSDAAQAATARLTLNANFGGGETFVLNGVTVEEAGATAGNVNFTAGANITASLEALRDALNASTDPAISQASYSIEGGNTLVITSRSGGEQAESFVIDDSAGTVFSVSARLTNTADVYVLDGGDNDGISAGEVTAIGSVGDSIINTQSQIGAFATLSFSSTAAVGDFDGETLDISIGDGAGDVTFTGIAAGAGTPTALQFQEVLNDDGTLDVESTLDTIVFALNNYTGNDDYSLSQVEARREGLNIIVQNNTAGNVLQTDRATALAAGVASTTTAFAATTLTITNGTLSANGTDTGVSLEGITNDAFVGTVSGFEAEFITNDIVNLSITVGDRTYRANDVNVGQDNLAAGTGAVRLTSTEGDFLDIEIAGAAASIVVNDQSDADDVAARLDTALSGLTFYQSRDVSSFSATGDIVVSGTTVGSLNGSSFNLNRSDFSDVRIEEVNVAAPLTGSDNATVEFVINGETYRSEFALSDQIGAGAVVTFVNASNGLDTLTFRNGDTVIELDNSDKAAGFEAALTSAFGIGEGGETLNFQVGVTTADSLEISIGTVTTEALYSGQTLDVLTQESAATAGDQLDIAIDAVTAVRAEVGALQSRFDFASANIESSLQNQDSARAVLLDTDVAAESTAFATAQVQLQAGISVLAQANLLQQNLLKLIG